MPKDRLLEFKNAASTHGNVEDDEVEVSVKTPFKLQLIKKNSKKKSEMEEDGGTGDKELDTFRKDIEWLSDNLENLTSKVASVKQTHASILSSPHINNELREQLEQQSQAIKKLSITIKDELKVIDGKIKGEEKENDEREKVGERKVHWADLRIKKSQYRAMMHRFTSAMTTYNEHQLAYREQCKKRIQKSLQIANREMTEEEIEDMIECQNPQIFSEQYSVMAQKAKLDLQELVVRHSDLVKLETSLREVHDLFVEASVLVHLQGEQIDKIELHMNETKDFVESSVQQTHQAVINKKKANKRKICIIGCLSVAGLILILLVTISIILG